MSFGVSQSKVLVKRSFQFVKKALIKPAGTIANLPICEFPADLENTIGRPSKSGQGLPMMRWCQLLTKQLCFNDKRQISDSPQYYQYQNPGLKCVLLNECGQILFEKGP